MDLALHGPPASRASSGCWRFHAWIHSLLDVGSPVDGSGCGFITDADVDRDSSDGNDELSGANMTVSVYNCHDEC